MNKYHVKVAMNGIPLPKTDMASVERFITEKINADLGDYAREVKISPVLKVDQEDGDLSGNLKNGYGNIAIDVSGVKLHIPFIVHEKMLIPFDVIRMGEQEVMYDRSKLQRIVNNLLNKMKTKEKEGDSFSIGEVVDGKDVSSKNGFLGTIMSIRDDEASKGGGASAVIPFSGPEFGVIDDDRLDRYANADVISLYHEVMEKISSVKHYTQEEVDNLADFISKQAGELSKERIEKVKNVELSDEGGIRPEQAQVKRIFNKIDDKKLADASRVASGNNVEFPTVKLGMYEKNSGRIFHKIEHLSKGRRLKKTLIKSIVVDNKNNYKFLGERDRFMVSVSEPKSFYIPMERGRGLQRDKMYMFEINPETVSAPFVVDYLRTAQYGPDTPRSFRFAENIEDRIKNTLFSECYVCREVLPSQVPTNSSDVSGQDFYTTQHMFRILISTDPDFQGMAYFNGSDLLKFIQENAMSSRDAKTAQELVETTNGDYYVIGPSFPFYKLEKRIKGHFISPDGFFSDYHNTMVKEAAYDKNNITRLIVEKSGRPKTYTIEWMFSTDTALPEQNTKASQLQKRRHSGLSEESARQLLLKLGYDYRGVESFFETIKRTGREARFPLRDVEKAKMISPQDIRTQVKSNFIGGLLDTTLNAGNFMPVMEDIIANAATRLVTGDLLKTSFEVASEMEKVAFDLKDSAWHELSALLNVKHYVDKVAQKVCGEGLTKNADEMFDSLRKLKPAISKYAKQIIEINRRQVLSYDKPLISPKLLKQALEQLEELYKYASIQFEGHIEKKASDRWSQQIVRVSNDALDVYMDYMRIKNNMNSGRDVSEEDKKMVQNFENDMVSLDDKGIAADGKKKLNKEANFAFSPSVFKGLLTKRSNLDEILRNLKNELSEIQKQIDRLRVTQMSSKKMDESNELLKLISEKERIMSNIEDINLLGGDVNQTLNNTQMAGLGLASIPVVGGASYGYQHFKHDGR